MGSILAKFRKDKTTVLEGLEEKIIELHRYTLNTQKQKKRFVRNFLALSIAIYVIAFMVCYFVYFPSTWTEQSIYLVPVLLFPVVIIILRRFFMWYFDRKLNNIYNKLAVLRTEKKKILEQVMEEETYNVTINLLNRFGDKNNEALTQNKPKVNWYTTIRNFLRYGSTIVGRDAGGHA